MPGPNGRAGTRFDLDAASAAALAESRPEPFLFVYKGADYEVPAAVLWPLEVQAQIARGDLEAALTGLMGADAYRALVAAGITVGELTTLFEAVGEAAGVGGLGNSPQPAPAGSTQT